MSIRWGEGGAELLREKLKDISAAVESFDG